MSTNPFSIIEPRPKLPVEPDEFDPREINAYYDWRNDMFFREFDLTGSGSVNFMTARRTYKVWLDEFGTPVVLTMGDPVFYWIDLNGNGKFEQELGEMLKTPMKTASPGMKNPMTIAIYKNQPGQALYGTLLNTETSNNYLTRSRDDFGKDAKMVYPEDPKEACITSSPK